MFTVSNPAPTLNSISPDSAVAGDPAFTLTILGINFLPSSVVRWNEAVLTTSFIGSSQLRAAVSASDLASAGMANVTVFTPGPGGGTSNALPFTINAPAQPGGSSASPAATRFPSTEPEQRQVGSASAVVATAATPTIRLASPFVDELRLLWRWPAAVHCT